MQRTSPSSSLDVAFDELEPEARFVTGEREITGQDVLVFAALTGDRHPQHVDERWARASPFGERVAHGMLVLSTAIGLLELNPERVVALRRVRDAVFKRPVRLGDAVHLDGQIRELRPVDDRLGLVVCGWSIVNQRGETVARVVAEVLWRRGGASYATDYETIAGPQVLPL